MRTKILALSLIVTILLVQSAAASTQEASVEATDTWGVLKSTPVRAELEVVMKSGKKLRGRLLDASDIGLKLSRKDEIADLNKGEISKVYRLLPKSREFQRLTSGIGATVGAGAGIAIGISAAQRSNRGLYTTGEISTQRSTDGGASVAIIAITIGSALGAIGGYLLGSRLKSRLLVYEAR